MLKLTAAAALVATFTLGSTAMAEEHGGLRQLTFQQLQAACQNPTAFQSQRQPNSIRLTCEDQQLVWEIDRSDSVEMDNNRKMVASLSSDKYYVIREEHGIPMSVSKTSCPRLKEVLISYTTSFALTCNEIQNFRGNMHDFCKARVDSQLASNASLATRTETGRVYDMCAAPALLTMEGKGQPTPSGQIGGQIGGAESKAH